MCRPNLMSAIRGYDRFAALQPISMPRACMNGRLARPPARLDSGLRPRQIPYLSDHFTKPFGTVPAVLLRRETPDQLGRSPIGSIAALMESR